MPQIAAQYWRTLVDSLSDVVCPPECLLCECPLDRGRLCEQCVAGLVSDYYRCQRCATPLPAVVPNKDCFRCRGVSLSYRSVLTLGPYSGQLRKAVVEMKKPRQEPLRQAIAELLAKLLQCHRSGRVKTKNPPQCIVPVPSHWLRSLSGAADTAGSLAAAVGKQTGITVVPSAIGRSRATAKQGMLAWSERPRNVRGAFAIRSAKQLIGRHVYLVDDVLTSGSTAAEICKVLRSAGAARVDVVVVARGTGARETVLVQNEPLESEN